ncbi:Transposase, IS4 [Pararhodospirillum photometricum DSM 122]|uniref:Transposase, IS4 n=1 Tax=Pararhodospirillum photometricum DSM 122 TaxID=1150469 RepID=H6SM79_PARPM|nr:Transposase, IS4 [Pararhodospirillum photometricum DSM 122]
MDFELFRPVLERAVRRRSATSKGGRPGFDAVLKFKMLVLQSLHGLALGRTTYLVRDRLSWMRFCGLGPGDAVPDANTLWDFREALITAGAFDDLFQRLDRAISEAGYLPMSGQIVDATLVSAPRQRNTEAKKQTIKEGKVPEDWRDKPAKLRQKDRDARWTVKFSKGKVRKDGTPQGDIAIPHFGYKNHVSIDRKHGIIRRALVTDAAAADGARLREGLIDPAKTASDVWADSAYRSEANEAFLAKAGKVSRIHRKKPKGKPMPRATARANAVKSRIRSRVEHVFAEMKGEGSDGAGHLDHRPRPRQGSDHARQHGLQHEALVLARPSGRTRLICARPGALPGGMPPILGARHPLHTTRPGKISDRNADHNLIERPATCGAVQGRFPEVSILP